MAPRAGRAAVGEVLGDAYLALFSVAMVGSMAGNVVVTLRRLADDTCVDSCAQAREVSPWLRLSHSPWPCSPVRGCSARSSALRPERLAAEHPRRPRRPAPAGARPCRRRGGGRRGDRPAGARGPGWARRRRRRPLRGGRCRLLHPGRRLGDALAGPRGRRGPGDDVDPRGDDVAAPRPDRHGSPGPARHPAVDRRGRRGARRDRGGVVGVARVARRCRPCRAGAGAHRAPLPQPVRRPVVARPRPHVRRPPRTPLGQGRPRHDPPGRAERLVGAGAPRRPTRPPVPAAVAGAGGHGPRPVRRGLGRHGSRDRPGGHPRRPAGRSCLCSGLRVVTRTDGLARMLPFSHPALRSAHLVVPAAGCSSTRPGRSGPAGTAPPPTRRSWRWPAAPRRSPRRRAG